MACNDSHVKAVDEGTDLLAEIDSRGRVVWRHARAALADQIEGDVDSRSSLEEVWGAHVRACDSEKPGNLPKSNRRNA